MLFGADLFVAQGLALGDFRQAAFIIIAGLFLVLALFIQLQKAGEIHHRARGAQVGRAVMGGNLDRGARQTGRFHLRGHGPLPDQVVQALLFIIEINRHIPRQAGKIRRPDGFMRFLGVFRLAAIDAGLPGHIVGTEFLADHTAAAGYSLVRHLYAVGPHIGDQTDRLAADIKTFIQALGNLHGALGAKAQLARGFLL